MNPTTSNAEYQSSVYPKTPGLFHSYARLRKEGGVDSTALRRFTLLQAPRFAAMLIALWWIATLAIWQPLEKAVFSWRYDLAFSYGDFILFFLISCVLLCGISVIFYRIYRHESALLYICNFGERSADFTFEGNGAHYVFEDAQGKPQRRIFAEDYTDMHPFFLRLIEARGGLPKAIFIEDSAREATKALQKGEAFAYVYYIPRQPQLCHMVMNGTMREYFWRKT